MLARVHGHLGCAITINVGRPSFLSIPLSKGQLVGGVAGSPGEFSCLQITPKPDKIIPSQSNIETGSNFPILKAIA